MVPNTFAVMQYNWGGHIPLLFRKTAILYIETFVDIFASAQCIVLQKYAVNKNIVTKPPYRKKVHIHEDLTITNNYKHTMHSLWKKHVFSLDK